MHEVRCITFTENETVNALLNHCRNQRRTLPTGTIQGLAIHKSDDGAVRVILRIIDDHGADRSVPFEEIELAASLVHFCIDRHIPLPAKSDRHLEVIDKEITLMIKVANSERTAARRSTRRA